MGGYIGWQFAIRHRDWLHRMIICDSRAAADSPEAAANRLKMADIVTKEGPEPVAWAMMPKLFAAVTNEKQPNITARVRQTVMQTNPLTIAAAHRGMAIRPDMTEQLPSITVPVLVIVGEHDAISPPAEMRSFSERLPNSRFIQIPSAGHMSPMENPAAVNAAIREFVAAT
jgi:pimeloyl-ACP methyl ester carboxylesterase